MVCRWLSRSLKSGCVAKWTPPTLVRGLRRGAEPRRTTTSSLTVCISRPKRRRGDVADPLRGGGSTAAGERTFRAPNEDDLAAIRAAVSRLAEVEALWQAQGIIPSEDIPEESNYERGHKLYGRYTWLDMFSPRQALVHGTFSDEFARLIPEVKTVSVTRLTTSYSTGADARQSVELELVVFDLEHRSAGHAQHIREAQFLVQVDVRRVRGCHIPILMVLGAPHCQLRGNRSVL